MRYKIIILFLVSILMLTPVKALEDEVITVTVGEIDVPVYQVDVSWDAMEFVYNEQVNYVWNNTSHIYELSNPTYRWITDNNSVNIINNSHMSINVNLNYNAIINDVLGSFDVSSVVINSGQSHTSKLNLSGELDNTTTNYTKIGFIDLTIS